MCVIVCFSMSEKVYNPDMRELTEHNAFERRSVEQLVKTGGGRPLLIPALSFMLAEECCYQSSRLGIFFLSALFLLSFLLLISSYRKKVLTLSFALSLAASLLISAFGTFITHNSLLVNQVDSETYMEITGQVVRCEMKLSGRTDIYIRTADYGLILYRSQEDEGLFPGSRVSFRGRLQYPSQATNPGQFDYRDYLKRKGVVYEAKRASEQAITIDNPGSLIYAGFIQKKMMDLRHTIVDYMSDGDAGEQAIIAALFMGDKSLIDQETESDFRKIGLSHVLAVSGTHFAGFLMALPALMGLLKIKKSKALLIYLASCLAVGFFTGWSESVTRAALMSVCAFAARDYLSGMSLALLLMGIADPFVLLGPAFRMSFASGLAIKLLAPHIEKLLSRLSGFKSLNSLLAVYLSARSGMLLFDQASYIYLTPFMICVHLCCGFLSQLSCAFFFPAALSGFLIRPISHELALPAVLPAEVLVRLVKWAADRTSAGGDPIEISWAVYLILFGLILVAVMPRCFIKKWGAVILLMSLALELGAGFYKLLFHPDALVVFIDVGQGDACLIMSEGKSCLIDAGTSEAGIAYVIPLLDYYGIQCPDLVMISHWDRDHAGGVLELLKRGRCKQIYSSYDQADLQTMDLLSDYLAIEGIEAAGAFMDEYVTCIDAGDSLSFGKAAIEVLYPEEALNGGNESSCVMAVDISGTDILFTGDIGVESEEFLLSKNLLEDIDILKVAHHGSRFSGSEAFIQAVCPEIAVISAGRHNVYGHPALQTIERLKAAGADIYVTRDCGAVTVEIFDGYYNVSGFI